MKKIILLSMLMGGVVNIYSQINKYSMMDLHPVSPTAFQFSKYTEMPVNEYTGIPSISVPLYDIEVDKLKIPINLTYHAGGIRVAEEASWVGLGWDLQIGSIVQTINDIDDLPNENYPYLSVVKRLPDYFPVTNVGGYAEPLPVRHLWPLAAPRYDWANPWIIHTPEAKQGFAIATDNYIPVNGQFDMPEVDLFTATHVDSEPDIFVASFLGYTIKFTSDFKGETGSQYHILNQGPNQGGFRVVKTIDGFRILTSSGDNYYFEVKSVIKNTSSSWNVFSGNSGSSAEIVSNIYFLSKIITANGKIAEFQYDSTAISNGYPQYSQKIQALTETSRTTSALVGGGGVYLTANHNGGGAGLAGSHPINTTSYNIEKYFYLKSVTFPRGRVDFNISNRQDIQNGKKLDYIELRNTNDQVIKKWDLTYSYFAANGSTSSADPLGNFRLKLLYLTDGEGGMYRFNYNSTQLPKKNSLAVDYWGFYNGRSTNISTLPNPSLLGHPELGDNGNEKNADIAYAKAGILESIEYPTGGNVEFEYELNTFTNSLTGSYYTQQFLSGAGLRVHKITHYTDESTFANRTIYTYEGGKLMNDVQVVRTLPFSELIPYSNTADIIHYDLTEISATGFFHSNPLSSSNGVGYTKVIKTEVDNAGNAKGRTETEYYNNENITNTSIPNYYLYCDVPAIKPIAPENGSAKQIDIFNNQNIKIKSIENTYVAPSSFGYGDDIFYGAKIYPYATMFYWTVSEGQYTLQRMTQNLVAYYPIYDLKTFLSGTVTTEYTDDNNIITTKKTYMYDNFGQVKSINTRVNNTEFGTTVPNNDRIEEYIDHGYEYDQGTGNPILVQTNRLDEITGYKVIKRKNNDFYDFKDVYKYTKKYATDKPVVTEVSIEEHPDATNTLPSVITYNKYDAAENLLESTVKGITNSFLYDYNGEFVTAEIKNASYDDVGHTSFETDGNGGFQFNGTSIDYEGAVTGKRVYQLGTGDIDKYDLDVTKKYFVSLWATQGTGSSLAVAVNGLSPTRTGKTKGAFTYYEWEISGIDKIQIKTDADANIDELRFSTAGANMTTYTYEPLVGMLTQCDVNNNVIYYEYDNFNRMNLIRDQDRNVIKKFTYKVAVPDNQHEGFFPVNSGSTTTMPYIITFTNTVTGTTTTLSGYPNNSVQQIGLVEAGTYNITFTPMYTFTGAIEAVVNGISHSGNVVSFANISISAAVSITISTSSEGSEGPNPCSITMSPGYNSPTSNIASNGATASFYLVFSSNTAMIPGTAYYVATINGDCRPSEPRTIAYSSLGRQWLIIIDTYGQMFWQLDPASPSPVNANSAIVGSGLTYQL